MIVQCVPNFSEGCRSGVVESIVAAMGSEPGAKVVDYSCDIDHNRCVVTLLGEPESVGRAMLSGAKRAVEVIDISGHTGEHPRIGAIDVVPIVPVLGATMEDCVAMSYDLGKSFADELGIPVYFYERSAGMGHRVNLAQIRKGGYEYLLKNGLTGDREPDLGPKTLHPTAGATVIGARGPLIAYNVNLRTSDVTVAKEIARRIRQTRDEGSGMTGVKAIGIDLRSRSIAQVSTNITEPHATSLFEVYQFIEQQAQTLGVEILESELIGELRQEAIIDALCDAIKLPTLHESRILDSWLPKK